MDKELEDAIKAFKEANGTLAGLKLKKLICERLDLEDISAIAPHEAVAALKIIAEAAENPASLKAAEPEPVPDEADEAEVAESEAPVVSEPAKVVAQMPDPKAVFARMNAPKQRKAVVDEPEALKGELPDPKQVYARMNAPRKRAAAE